MGWNYCADRLPPMKHRVDFDGDTWFESDLCLIYARTPNDKPTYGLAVLCDGAWSGITYDETEASAVDVIAWQRLPMLPEV